MSEGKKVAKEFYVYRSEDGKTVRFSQHINSGGNFTTFDYEPWTPVNEIIGISLKPGEQKRVRFQVSRPISKESPNAPR